MSGSGSVVSALAAMNLVPDCAPSVACSASKFVAIFLGAGVYPQAFTDAAK